MELLCAKCKKPFMSARRARQYCSYTCSNAVTAVAREAAKLKGKPTTVWSCGGGVQSTAVAVLIEQGKLPKPDYALITDNGWEKSSTWEYVNEHLSPRLEAFGVRLHIVKSADYVDTSLLDHGDYVRIPAYHLSEGKVGKLKTICSGLWKGKVARKWMREQGIKRADNWLGMSIDEQRRARPSTLKWVQLRYPLIDLGINREDCLWLINDAGWPRPPRTSCYLCPQQDDASWLRLQTQYPDDWERAVEAERAIQKQRPDIYLHNSAVPLSDVEFKPTWREMMTECDTEGVQCWG